MPAPEAYTPAEVAALLRMSVEKVIGLIHSRRLAAVNVSLGRKQPRWRVSPEAVKAFLRGREPVAPDHPPPARRKRAAKVVEYW